MSGKPLAVASAVSVTAVLALVVTLTPPADGAAGPAEQGPEARAGTTAQAAGPEWAANVSVIEACSCPMFCQCYFGTAPAGHHDHASGGQKHFCRANLAHRVNRGHYGDVKLDGAKYWIASDLGDDFSDGEMEWAMLYFDRNTSKAQREAIGAIMSRVFPVKWGSFQTAEADIDTWKVGTDTAVATLDGGRSGEIRLRRLAGNTAGPVVISNLKYWGVPRHEGFVLMPNEIEAYRVGPKAFEFKGTNGFMITWDMTSRDVAASSQTASR